MWFYIIAFTLIIILLILLSFFWPPDSPWSPHWRTDKKAAFAAAKLAKINNRDIVYELGSGDGEFAIVAANEFGAKVVGIEIDPVRYLISKIRILLNNLSSKVKIIRGDFKKIGLESATVVYFYLVPNAIKRILPKLKKELRVGTRIVSYRYRVDLPLVSTNKKHKLYLYKIA